MKQLKHFLLTLCLLLVPALALVLAFAPAEAFAQASIQMRTPAFSAGDQLYFGEYNGDPVLWQVTGTGSGVVALRSTYVLFNAQYDSDNTATGLTDTRLDAFNKSELFATLNANTGSFKANSFTPAERAAISGDITIPTSYEGFINNTTGDYFSNFYWYDLPQRYYSATLTTWFWAHLYVDPVYLGSNYFFVDAVYGVVPVMNIGLSSVVFVSAASGAGAKSSATVGSGLTKAITPTGAVKFTMMETGLSLTCADNATRIVKAGDAVSITYSGATTGANKYVSCVVKNSAGVVLYYGKMVDCAGGNAAGTVSFTVPAAADLPDGNYTVQLFSEEANADYNTDYCSAPVSIGLTVDNTAPTLTTGAVDRTSDTSGTVKFTSNEAGTYYWQMDASPGGASGLVALGTNATPLTAAEQTVTLTLTIAQNNIYIAACDAAGNVSNMLVFTTFNLPTGVAAVNCTTIDNNNGQITGVYSAMEYSADGGTTWTACSGSSVTGLTPGAYQVRMKASGSILPSASVVVTVGANTDLTAPTLTAGAVSRTSDTDATVKFTSDEAGQYYYEIVSGGAAQPVINTSGAGTACGAIEETITLTTLTAGAQDIYIVVKDAAGNVSASSFHISIPAFIPPVITIDAQPAATTAVTEGDINASLSVAASVTSGATLAYEWFSNTTNANTGGTSTGVNTATFVLPAMLTAPGPYYYYCVVSATGGATPVASHTATVTVAPPTFYSVFIVASTGGTVARMLPARLLSARICNPYLQVQPSP